MCVCVCVYLCVCEEWFQFEEKLVLFVCCLFCCFVSFLFVGLGGRSVPFLNLKD